VEKKMKPFKLVALLAIFSAATQASESQTEETNPKVKVLQVIRESKQTLEKLEAENDSASSVKHNYQEYLADLMKLNEEVSVNKKSSLEVDEDLWFLAQKHFAPAAFY
jgi:anti-sigma-K factor RskA